VSSPHISSPLSDYPPSLHSFPTRRSSDLRMPSPRFSTAGWVNVPYSIVRFITYPAIGGPRSMCNQWCLAISVTLRQPEWPLPGRSEEHTSELQSREKLVCRLLLGEKYGEQ